MPTLDYTIGNYCTKCRLFHKGKDLSRCVDCNQKLRTKARTNMRNRYDKQIELNPSQV